MKSTAVPLIPGLLSTQRHMIGRTDFRKGQLLHQMAQGKDVDPKNNQLQPPEPAVPAKASSTAAAPASTAAAKPASSAFRTDATQPRWLTHDRQVLRFFGFFQEPVIHHERFSSAALSSSRVRRVVVFLYLTDHTISVSEPRVLNSGIPQGEFLKRSAVTKPNGAPYAPQDLLVGGHVKLGGRTIQLVDCDDATRKFYLETLAFQQGSAIKYPDDDSSDAHAAAVAQLQQSLRQRAAVESKSERVRKFHAHAQQVLRFFVSWQDPHPLYPETRQYVLHFYLADDTLEVVEPKAEREGRGHFAVLLSRRKAPREDHSGSSSRPIQATDLRCGEYVSLCARRFFLEDCDAFTREFYLETHGVTQEKCEPPPSTVHRGKAAKWKLFQVNPKEILGGLHHHSHTTNTGNNSAMEAAHRFHQNDAMEHKQLRFKARFVGDASREFVLTFFLEDDTLSVFEPRVKNSGVVGGRFLDRGRFRKSVASGGGDVASREQDKARSAYKASDFFVGAVVSFEFAPSQRLELVEADRQTLLFCESHPSQFPFSDREAVLASVCSAFSGSSGAVRRQCRAMDASRSGVLTIADTTKLLHGIGVARGLNAQQLITLCRTFEGAPQTFVYDDFCDALASGGGGGGGGGGGATDVYGKLRQCESLRRLLRERERTDRRGLVEMGDVAAVATAFKVALASGELQDLARQFRCGGGGSKQGEIDLNALCDRVFDGPAGERVRRGGDKEEEEEVGERPLHSLRRPHHNSGDSDDDEFGGGSGGDECLPESPRRVPSLPLAGVSKQRGAQPLPAPRTPTTSPSVVVLLRRVFGDRKYQLRKALRDRDGDKSGLLGEEAFMEAVLAVEPALSDDDTYAIADVYFPTNNSVVDYSKLLEAAFRS